jgi:membrane protease subunit (stomatin/prohibitin family)
MYACGAILMVCGFLLMIIGCGKINSYDPDGMLLFITVGCIVFIFGAMLCIIASIQKAAKKINDQTQTPNKQPNAQQSINSWECANCGKVNLNYVGTCGCGQTKDKNFPTQQIQSSLLSDIQKPTATSALGNTPDDSVIASLKQYKELLDTGIITQEEFDRKKKELLNL